MQKLLSYILLGLAFIFTSLLWSCSDDDPGVESESTNKKTGFIITGTTSSGTAVAKYFEQMPSGSADLSDGTDFQSFFPTAIFDHAIFLSRPDGSAGFAKIVIDENGDFLEEGVLPTVESSSFRIGVRDANTGVFQDRATPDLITVFNPTTLEITGSIDMSQAPVPGDIPQRYQRFVFRGDDIFSPIRGNDNTLFSGFYLHQASLATNSFVSATGIDSPASGGVLTVNNYGQGLVDADGSLYFQDGGAIGSGTFSRIYKIPAGSNEIDPNYVFEPVKALNPANIFYPTMNGFKLVGNGLAIAKVNAETPQAAIDIITNAGGLQNVLGNQDLINQILNELFTAESAEWCELDLKAQTVTPIAGAPKLGANSTSNAIFEYNGEIYFPIATGAEQAFYKYTPGTPTASKAFDVTGADIAGGFNIANDN